MLPPEFISSHSTIAEVMPEKFFSISLIFSKFSGFFLHSPLILTFSPLRGEGNKTQINLTATANNTVLRSKTQFFIKIYYDSVLRSPRSAIPCRWL